MNRNQILKSLRNSEKMLDARHPEYIEHYQQTIHAIENAAAFYLGDNIISRDIISFAFPDGDPILTSEDHLTHLPFQQIFLYGSIATKRPEGPISFGTLIQEKTDMWKQKEVSVSDLRSFDFTVTSLMIGPEDDRNPKIQTVAISPFVGIPSVEESSKTFLSIHLIVSPAFSQYLQEDGNWMKVATINEVMAYYFLKLLSCKNIIVQKEYSGDKNKKKRIPSLEYNTIHIRVPGNKYVYQNKEYESIPFHDREKFGMTGQKRGHFKTYTEEKPLFGRHTGTWWWSPMFDTSRKRDYEIKRI